MRLSTFSRYSLFCLIPVFSTACGVSPEEAAKVYTYDGPGLYDERTGEVSFPGTNAYAGANFQAPAMSDEERAGYCAIYTAPEENAATRRAFLEKLVGVWKRESKPKPLEVPFGNVFTFALQPEVRASMSGAFLYPEQDITAERVCLSKPLKRNDAYNGFRILELKSKSSEGIAALGVKFAPPQLGHSYPVLWVTEYDYNRYGVVSPLKSEDSLFDPKNDSERSVRIWVYPTKE